MKSFKLAAALFCLTLMAAGSAHATAIEYIFTGTADGSLNGVAFSGQNFTVNLFGDTSNITSGGGEFGNVTSPTTFSVGANTGSFTGTFNEVVSNPSFNGVIFGQLNGSGFFGEGMTSPALSTYDLSTAFPLTSGNVSQTADSLYNTNVGDLVFHNISAISFEADLSPTPLPASLPLFASGLGLMGLLGFMRKRKAARAI